jgi:hypothetical protein
MTSERPEEQAKQGRLFFDLQHSRFTEFKLSVLSLSAV